MMPYKSFRVEEPCNKNELGALLTTIDAKTKIMAGGTDIMPNLKNGLYDIDRIISLKRIADFKQLIVKQDAINLGSLITLEQVARHPGIKQYFPALASASEQIASPQIRAMGTVGGNICLDTRCLYINQSAFWRTSLGHCLKKDGTVCHVVKTGKRCVAAASNDLATVLLAYDATLDIMTPHEKTILPLRELYHADGVNNKHLDPQHVISSVSISMPHKKWGGFYKLRHRDSIDFPLLSVAVCFELDKGLLQQGSVVVNALVAKPKVFDLMEFHGRHYDHNIIATIAHMAQSKCHPQTNICDNDWRKSMIAIAVERAFLHAQKPGLIC